MAESAIPNKYELNRVKEKRKKLRKPFYGVPEEIFIEAAQRGISASRRVIASRLKALRRKGREKR
jgi:hypothetical protein